MTKCAWDLPLDVVFKSPVLLFKVGFSFTWVEMSRLGPITKEDRNDSKHKVTVCMLVKRTIEYCNWMAAVTSGHMLFSIAHGNWTFTTQWMFWYWLPFNTETACYSNVSVSFSPPPPELRGLNCLSWIPWFHSHDRHMTHRYSYNSYFFFLSVSLEQWELVASCCMFSAPVVLNSLFVIRASIMDRLASSGLVLLCWAKPQS